MSIFSFFGVFCCKFYPLSYRCNVFAKIILGGSFIDMIERVL